MSELTSETLNVSNFYCQPLCPNLVQVINQRFATVRSLSNSFVVFQYFRVCSLSLDSFED